MFLFWPWNHEPSRDRHITLHTNYTLINNSILLDTTSWLMVWESVSFIFHPAMMKPAGEHVFHGQLPTILCKLKTDIYITDSKHMLFQWFWFIPMFIYDVLSHYDSCCSYIQIVWFILTLCIYIYNNYMYVSYIWINQSLFARYKVQPFGDNCLILTISSGKFYNAGPFDGPLDS